MKVEGIKTGGCPSLNWCVGGCLASRLDWSLLHLRHACLQQFICVQKHLLLFVRFVWACEDNAIRTWQHRQCRSLSTLEVCCNTVCRSRQCNLNVDRAEINKIHRGQTWPPGDMKGLLNISNYCQRAQRSLSCFC